MAVLGAAGVTGLAIAGDHYPDGFWASSTGQTRHGWLIWVCAVVGILAAIVFYGWAPVREATAKVRRYQAQVGEALGFLVGALASWQSQGYEELVDRYMADTTSADAKNELVAADPINVVEFAASFHEVTKRPFRPQRLEKVNRFAIGADRQKSTTLKWKSGEGLLGAVWQQDTFGCQLIGGASDRWDPSSPLRAALAIPVLSEGTTVGILSVSVLPQGAPDLLCLEAALSSLSRCKDVIDPYRLLLSALVREFS